jgi:hypothetical protein
MYTVLHKIPISANYYIEIVTNNYLRGNILEILLTYNERSILLSETAALALCNLRPIISDVMSKISHTGTLNYYFCNYETTFASLEIERHFDETKCRHISTWRIETYNLDTGVKKQLQITRFLFRLLSKVSEDLQNKLCEIILDRIHAQTLHICKKRNSVQSLTTECKWAILGTLPKNTSLTDDILMSIPQILKEFLTSWP